jgi:hypothetical protein
VSDALVSPDGGERFSVRGKFIYRGEEKFLVKGVTYGTFAPNADGDPYPPPGVVARDFDEISSRGLNSIRTYVPPPRWLLDLAADRDLAVLVGFLLRLHSLADNRPLVMAEIGLDSRRNGGDARAEVLDWQVRATFAPGCAGALRSRGRMTGTCRTCQTSACRRAESRSRTGT